VDNFLFVTSANPNIIERKERWARKMSGKAKPATRSENRLPPGQHLTSGFPVLDLGIRPDISLEKWRLEVSGLVENPKTFTWEEFTALPRFGDVSDFHCVTTWSKFDCRWSGVAFFTLAEIVKPEPEVRHVLFTSYDASSSRNSTLGKARSSCAQSSSRPKIGSVSGNSAATATPPIPGPRTGSPRCSAGVPAANGVGV
jgi:DMSO/TMAO reductase YedYZ molybdopterin-dependent catalytic subunit